MALLLTVHPFKMLLTSLRSKLLSFHPHRAYLMSVIDSCTIWLHGWNIFELIVAPMVTRQQGKVYTCTNEDKNIRISVSSMYQLFVNLSSVNSEKGVIKKSSIGKQWSIGCIIALHSNSLQRFTKVWYDKHTLQALPTSFWGLLATVPVINGGRCWHVDGWWQRRSLSSCQPQTQNGTYQQHVLHSMKWVWILIFMSVYNLLI